MSKFTEREIAAAIGIAIVEARTEGSGGATWQAFVDLDTAAELERLGARLLASKSGRVAAIVREHGKGGAAHPAGAVCACPCGSGGRERPEHDRDR